MNLKNVKKGFHAGRRTLKMSRGNFRNEVRQRERFEFGKNWKQFLTKLNDQRIQNAQTNLEKMLEPNALAGKTFLDIGSGSGLSSLAARNAGAKVTSFDFDDSSVWCTNELRSRYYPCDSDWTVLQGSILDNDFLNTIGHYDIVYSWGVLHHTGEMWAAIDNASRVVAKSGILFIAIYNDQGLKSHFWWIVKYFYNHLPRLLQRPFAYLMGSIVKVIMLIKYTIKLKPMLILGPIFNYQNNRGMSMLSDMVDWYGGFPFEFAKFDHLVRYIESKGFKLINGQKAGSLGCHELVFRKV